MSNLRCFTFVLVILAIVSAGVSPACAFVSGGTSFIQICGADGEIQKVEVDAALDPFADEAPMPLEDALESFEQCPFCFATSSQKYTQAGNLGLNAVLPISYLPVSAGTAVPQSFSLRGFDARGPPQIS